MLQWALIFLVVSARRRGVWLYRHLCGGRPNRASFVLHFPGAVYRQSRGGWFESPTARVDDCVRAQEPRVVARASIPTRRGPSFCAGFAWATAGSAAFVPVTRQSGAGSSSSQPA